jgi:phosphate transport system substrate-binding protein
MALATTACGTDDNTTGTADAGIGCPSGSVVGAGSTFVQNLAQQWVKDFSGQCDGATVNYQGVGSGAGIQQFISGTVDFGASDAVMKPNEQSAAEAKGGPVLHIPWSAGGIAVEYNLRGVDLRLSPETLAGIFQGIITRWDDPALKADNPDQALPAKGIQVVHRSDGSGTTDAFTSYLHAVAPSVWKAGAGKDVQWPTGQGAKGSDGVTAAVKQAEGAIGYAEVSFAKGGSLGIARIKNAAGNFVPPDERNVSAALAGAVTPPDLKIKVDYLTTDPSAYPISTPTWALVFKKPADPAKGKVVKAFVLYALAEGQVRAASLYYAPLPAQLAAEARRAVESMEA